VVHSSLLWTMHLVLRRLKLLIGYLGPLFGLESTYSWSLLGFDSSNRILSELSALSKSRLFALSRRKPSEREVSLRIICHKWAWECFTSHVMLFP